MLSAKHDVNDQPEVVHIFSVGSYYILYSGCKRFKKLDFSVVATIKVKAELVNLIPKSEKMCGVQQAHISHRYVITVNNEIKSF